MTDNATPQIDVMKPLELEDGTPVTLVNMELGGFVVRVGTATRYFYHDGGHRYGEMPNLRNVIPAFDTSSPLQFTDGSGPATFLADTTDGRLVVEDCHGGTMIVGRGEVQERKPETRTRYFDLGSAFKSAAHATCPFGMDDVLELVTEDDAVVSARIIANAVTRLTALTPDKDTPNNA